MEYTELDHYKKVNHIKLSLYDEILHSLIVITLNLERMVHTCPL